MKLDSAASTISLSHDREQLVIRLLSLLDEDGGAALGGDRLLGLAAGRQESDEDTGDEASNGSGSGSAYGSEDDGMIHYHPLIYSNEASCS